MDHGSLNTKISQKINGAAADLAPATTGAATSWRDTLRIHPACAMFPLLPPDELRALGEDIRANGMTSHILTEEVARAVIADPNIVSVGDALLVGEFAQTYRTATN
jgi:hypothetical protein